MLRGIRKYSVALCLAGLICIACVLRCYFIAQGWPGTNSDEATIDLMALHIATGKDYPLFFYGQGYMGALDAYMGAVFFRLIGPSIFSLRLGLIFLFAGFLLVMYYLTRVLYSRGLALLVVLIFSFGSMDVINLQLFANGGYPETLFFSACLFLLASRLVLLSCSSQAEAQSVRMPRLYILYACLGIVMGLALYSDLLVTPIVCTCLLLLFLFARRDLFSRPGLVFVLCLLIGLAPAIIYNLIVPFNQGTITYFFASSGYVNVHRNVSFVQQVLQSLLVTLPDAVGSSPVCFVHEPVVPLANIFAVYASDTVTCSIQNIGWTCGYICLWSCSTIITLVSLRRMLTFSSHKLSAEKRYMVALYSARFMILLAVFLIFVFYVFSTPAAINPYTTVRYLVCMIIALPALLWPLWSVVVRVSDRSYHRLGGRIRRLVARWISLFCLISIVFLFMKGSIDIFPRIAQTHQDVRQQQDLVHELEYLGITRFYTDYWVCNELIFQSQEKLICAVLDDQFHAGYDRYLLYRAVVHTSPLRAYVFRINTAQDLIIKHRLAQNPTLHYQHYLFEGFDIYRMNG